MSILYDRRLMMQSFSSLDFASEFVCPIPVGFSKPVRQIKFYKHNTDEVDSVLDTAKENICPFKVRYILLQTNPNELLKDIGNVQLHFEEEPEELSIIPNESEHADTEELKANLLKKFSDLSEPLQESLLPIDSDKAEFQLRHFDSFLSSKPNVVAFIESNRVKFIYTSDDDKTVLAEEFETLNDKIICETINNIDKKEIIKLQLDRESFLNEAAKIEIGEDYVKIEGFTSDVASTKLKIYKALQVNHTLTETLDGDVSILFTKETAIKFCNEKIKQLIPNRKFLLWKMDGVTLYVVGKNNNLAKKGLETIKSCICTFEDDFSGLTFPEESNLVHFNDTLQRDFQGGIVFNDTDLAKLVVTTTSNRGEQAKLRMKDFKMKFTLATKTIKCSAEKAFYLEASQEDLKAELFSGHSLAIEKGAEKEDLKITAYRPEVSTLEQKSVVTKSFGLNKKEFVEELRNRMQEQATEMNCKFKIQDIQVQVLVKDERIEVQQVDVIVNSVSSDLDISATNENSVTYSISKAAGPAARESLKQKYPKGLNVGEVAIGDKGGLNCKALYHVVLEKFNLTDKNEKFLNLRKVICTCLKTAKASGYTSIAFPALAAGVHCYPHAMVAEILLDCIVNHVYSNFETVLRTVILAIPPRDIQIKKAFTDEMEKRKRSLKEVEQGKPCLTEHPKWLCEWKVDIVGESDEEIQYFVKMINRAPK